MKSVNRERVNSVFNGFIVNAGSHKALSIQFAVLLLLFFVLYVPVISALVRMWWNSDDYSHGFLVPLISFYFVWLKREKLRALEIEPALWWGGLVLFLAGFMLIAGKAGGFIILQELSLLVAITGLLLLLGGKEHLKTLSFPLIYLLFMIKMFEEGDDRFHWPFQLAAAKIGIGILHFFGFTAYREENYIQLPNALLEVATACSGIRFLVSIVAIGIPLAYLTQRTWLRRIGLVLFALVIAIIGNGVRVALIGMWTYTHGTSMIHGPFHIFYGVFVSWIGFVALFAGVWILGKERSGREDKIEPVRPSGIDRHRAPEKVRKLEARNSRSTFSWFFSLIFLLLTGGVYYFHQIGAVPLEKNLMFFPKEIGKWQGEEADIKIEGLRIPKADQEMMRTYWNFSGEKVNLYIAYFDSQNQEKKLINYLTSWKYHRGESVVDIPFETGGSYQVNYLLAPVEGKKMALYFWYDIGGRIVSSRYKAKLWTMWDALVYGRSNGAMVAVSEPLEQNSDLKTIRLEEERFISELGAPLHHYLVSREDRVK